MVNKYKTLEEATKSWENDSHWDPAHIWFIYGGAAVCREKWGRHFFIITGYNCVEYRKAKGQVIKMLRMKDRMSGIMISD